MSTQDQAAPEPLLTGKFAVFETPDGGYHVSYRPEGDDDDQHMEIPGLYVKLMKKKAAAGGGLRRMLGMAG